MIAPFPYFGGKRSIVDDVWARLGRPKQYIEPFCGSCAMLLGAPQTASLEVVNDVNGFIANFWRCVTNQPDEVARWATIRNRPQPCLRGPTCASQQAPAGVVGDYDLPGWDATQWDRCRLTYSGGETTALECIWYSPACLPAAGKQVGLFG